MKLMFKKTHFFPALFVVNTIFSFYFLNFYEAKIIEIVLILLVMLSLTIILWYLFWLITKDKNKAAIMIFFTSMFFLSFQSIVNLLRVTSGLFKSLELVRFWKSDDGQIVALTIILIFLIIGVVLIYKSRRSLSNFIVFFNVLTFIMLLFTVFEGFQVLSSWGVFNTGGNDDFSQYWQYEVLDGNSIEVDSKLLKPDVYYIIVDGFTRGDMLFELYGIDTNSFLHELSDRGFFIGTESYSNYPLTRTSLASSLNMMYLNEIVEASDIDKSSSYPAYHMIDNSLVEQTFNLLNYELVSFQSVIDYTDFSDWDIYYKNNYIPSNFVKTFLSSSALSPFINPILNIWHYEEVQGTLENIPLVATKEGPTFAFAHIFCPHPPFIINGDGTLHDPNKLYELLDAEDFLLSGSVEDYRRGYANQVIFLQNYLIRMIDRIIADSTDPFIIIIQGDHGSRMQLNQGSLEKTNINEGLSILNGYYFFDQDYENLYESISPVNTFRVIFSQYFGIEKNLLEDKHFYAKFDSLFDFIPVDSRLN